MTPTVDQIEEYRLIVCAARCRVDTAPVAARIVGTQRGAATAARARISVATYAIERRRARKQRHGRWHKSVVWVAECQLAVDSVSKTLDGAAVHHQHFHVVHAASDRRSSRG